MKGTKRIVLLLMAAALLLSSSALAEAFRYTPDPEKPAYLIDPVEHTKLTWYFNADWFNTSWGEDPVTRTIKEKLKVDVELIVGDDTKLNGLFGANEVPDIITIFGMGSPMAQNAMTWALPLNELADKYDPYFYKAADPETLGWFKLADGNTYGYPSYSNTSRDYASGAIKATTAFVIREDVYKALGEPRMGTEEEFLDTLSKIKEKYPELLPFGMRSFAGSSVGSLGDVFQDFLGVPLANEDKSFYDRNLDPEYLRWIRILNKAYRMGMISDDSFADDNTAFEEKVASGKYATVFASGTPQLSGAFTKNIAADAARKYIAIDGPQSALGNKPTLAQSGISGWTVSFVSKSCKDPAKAIQLFTYLISQEGQELYYFGVKGETFDIDPADGKHFLLPEVMKERQENIDNFKRKYRLGEFLMFGHDSFFRLNGKDVGTPSIRQMEEWGEGKLLPHFILENINPEDGTPEARNLQNVWPQWGTTLAMLLRAPDDAGFDQILEDYKAFLQNIGWEQITAIFSEKMKLNAERLGL